MEKRYNECPFGRSDHVILEIEIKGNMEDKQDESYKKKKGIMQKLTILQ